MAVMPKFYKIHIDGLTVDLEPIYEELVSAVRCKDCKYGDLEDPDFPLQYFCQYDGCAWNKADHFCSYGERKNGDNE